MRTDIRTTNVFVVGNAPQHGKRRHRSRGTERQQPVAG